ncbi:MAG TPA: terminase [Blastocatellia bacterium]|nr:terminase [Blastocatellia bacterium]
MADNWTKWTPEKERFLKKLRLTGGNVSRAARAARVSRSTVYFWRDEDSDFAKAWDDAIEEGLDDLEQEARRRAFKGTKKPVYQGGRLAGYVQEYSDTLLIFLLKGGRPKKYRERFEHSGPDGQPLGVVLLPQAPASVEEWQQLVQQQITPSSQDRKPS